MPRSACADLLSCSYGAQHPLVVVKRNGAVTGPTKKCVHAMSLATLQKAKAKGDLTCLRPLLIRYVVVGHCCESGDLLSPAPGEPETISERELVAADIGDLCVIEGR